MCSVPRPQRVTQCRRDWASIKIADITTLRQVEELTESVEFEAKKAQGRDGKGVVPDSIWETCSAFANTNGGLILLGIEQLADNSLRVVGIADPDKVRRDFWCTVKNKLSRNIFKDDDVAAINLDGKPVIAIAVPRAGRTDRPVYVGSNPLTGTYRRAHEADQRCEDAAVKSMLADSISPDRTCTEVEGFTIEDDLNMASIEAFRRRVAVSNPGSDFLTKKTADFLRAVGAVRKNRSSNRYVPTLAGLLMFGNHSSIKERLPEFNLDYRKMGDANARYEDRVIFDGTWSGNLFDFFAMVSTKLYQGVPREFALNTEMQRVDEGPVVVALREAFVNTLIHADHELRGGVIVVQSSDQYYFRNPGTMRVPLEQAVHGGLSDCRNPILQQMFRFMGAAEQMGSGVPRIIDAWTERSWQRPELREDSEPDRTELTMKMADFLPKELVTVLKRMGDNYDRLSREEKYTLGLALLGHEISNSRLRRVTGNHPRDVTIMLGQLVNRGLLKRVGNTSAAVYVAGATLDDIRNGGLGSKSRAAGWGGDETHQVQGQTPQVSTETPQVSAESESEAPAMPLPLFGVQHQPFSLIPEDAVSVIDVEESIVTRVRDAKYADQALLLDAIVALCSEQPRGLAELAVLLNRNRRYLATFVSQLVADGLVEPTEQSPAHPRQRYRAK